ncbi:MAG: hypothetical protein WBQ78_17395 [Gammaproteobacteria bacterium]
MSFCTIKGPADRLWGAQSQRKFLTQMGLDQWTQSGELVRPEVKRFTPD